MTPTIISKEHFPLNNKLKKPWVEKMRRYCINSSIEQLKCLLAPEFFKEQPESKLEKADILEMTHNFLQHHNSSSHAVNQGFSRYRINSSIEQLKCLLAPEFFKQQPESKLEKADILEMTLNFMQRHNSSSHAVNQSFSRCVQR
ncbi:hypothetical protein G5714_011409 [Onychostoma macrolepis]|uniref:BHLH domain-containing protein n=1 Tax=Onychostoma macrolepis TaxID=369639 RepID=A0A7J6CKF4_9TELE|nr:hypothetical protein G5714_011409 [Onychostoma macrolepis]